MGLFEGCLLNDIGLQTNGVDAKENAVAVKCNFSMDNSI